MVAEEVTQMDTSDHKDDQVAAAASADQPPAPAIGAAEEKKPKAEETPPAAVETVDAPKEKKPRSPKPKTASHPPYFQMIKEALVALDEKSGSSSYAIAKYMEEKHKSVLPANFRKILTLQLKNSVGKGKLFKIKSSYKLSESGKKDKSSPSKSKPSLKAKAATAATTTRPKTKKKKTKTKSVNNPETGKRAPPAKKPLKSAPAKAKQPRSIRSPASRAKRANAAAA